MTKMLGRIGEYGYIHQISVGVDLSSIYTSSSIFYKDPDGNVTEKTCDDVSSADGEFGWVVTDGFFDQAGRWEAQLEVVVTGGVRKLKIPIVFWIGEDGE